MKFKNKHYYVTYAYHSFCSGPEHILDGACFKTYEAADAYRKQHYDPEATLDILLYLGKCWWKIEHSDELNINT